MKVLGLPLVEFYCFCYSEADAVGAVAILFFSYHFAATYRYSTPDCRYCLSHLYYSEHLAVPYK